MNRQERSEQREVIQRKRKNDLRRKGMRDNMKYHGKRGQPK